MFTAYDFVGILGVVVFPLWIVGSLWLARAHRNAEMLDPPGLRRSIVWSWLGWWVPFVSLWFPEQIVDDPWRITTRVPGSPDPRGFRRRTGIWWGLWVGYLLLTHVISRIELTQVFRSGAATGAADVRQGVFPPLLVVVAVVSIAAYLAWIPVVRGLSRAQAELSRRV